MLVIVTILLNKKTAKSTASGPTGYDSSVVLLHFNGMEALTLPVTPLSWKSVSDKLSSGLKVLLVWLSPAREVGCSRLLSGLGFISFVSQALFSVHLALMRSTFIELLVVILAAALPSASNVFSVRE